MPGQRAHRESDHATDDVDDHHAAGTIELAHVRRHLADEHDVERNVQQPAVQPLALSNGPPATEFEDRDRTGVAEIRMLSPLGDKRFRKLPPGWMPP
jgi:hypothetical protein